MAILPLDNQIFLIFVAKNTRYPQISMLQMMEKVSLNSEENV